MQFILEDQVGRQEGRDWHMQRIATRKARGMGLVA
jgi:hypothetical protein